jgi:arylsulfatase A-like enzyme
MVRDESRIAFEPCYCTDVFTDNALVFLEQQSDSDAPFYLSLHYTAPHRPWDRAEHPLWLYDEYYHHCAFNSVPDEPRHPDFHNPVDFFESAEARRVALSGYYAATEAMDTNLGRIISWLERRGLRDNTLIVFTSDNGMNMGHHGICGKGNGTLPINMYDTSVKVPTIISHPGHVPAGLVCDDLFSHYDLMPTLLDYVGLSYKGADRLPGRSFADLLRGEARDGAESVIVLGDAVRAEYGPARMIRTRDWKYIHRYPDGPHEIYHLREDPGEQGNLIDDPTLRARISEMRARLAGWFASYVDRDINGAALPVSGRGQYDLATIGSEAFARRWVGPTEWWGDRHVPQRRL